MQQAFDAVIVLGFSLIKLDISFVCILLHSPSLGAQIAKTKCPGSPTPSLYSLDKLGRL